MMPYWCIKYGCTDPIQWLVLVGVLVVLILLVRFFY